MLHVLPPKGKLNSATRPQRREASADLIGNAARQADCDPEVEKLASQLHASHGELLGGEARVQRNAAETGEAWLLHEGNDSMTGEAVPSVSHLAWVIDGRAKNQKAALEIFELMRTYRNEIRNQNLSREVQDLIAIAFSLWRAVFLADRSGQTDAKLTDAQIFIGKMLTDNAITFTQDRAAREWTFNYYVDNALYRLEDLGFERDELLPLKGERTPKKGGTTFKRHT